MLPSGQMPTSSIQEWAQALRNSVYERVTVIYNLLDVNLIGVCPEAQVTYPRINPAQRKDNELTNGHTHFFLIGEEKGNKYDWGEEAKMKFELAQRIAVGRNKFGGNKHSCKIVTILLGDNPACYKDIDLVSSSLLVTC